MSNGIFDNIVGGGPVIVCGQQTYQVQIKLLIY